MKKFIAFLIILLSAGGLYYFFILPKAVVQVVDGPRSRDINSAARNHLNDYATNIDASISTLILGEQSQTQENAWNFRGAIKSTTSTRTIFGSVQNICSDFEKLECWRLSSLSIDGETVPLNSGESMEMEASSEEAVTTTNVGETQSATPAQNDQETEAAQEDNSPPPEIWHTRTDKVNGRTGPGTEFPIAFKVPADVPLTFIKQQDNWGQFSYLAQGGGTGKIWVSMNLVEQR